MKLYNTLTRKKEVFIPLVKGEVKIYSCGPTVYNYFHLGNARPFVVFDTLRRYFEYRGYKVTFVQNFTDIDDKMIAQAREDGISVRELADKFIEEYYHDADNLNVLRPTHAPRATETIDEIIDLISGIEKKGYAYLTGDGLYFDVKKFDDYGKLSGFDLDSLEMNAAERLIAGSGKINKEDFVLWKLKKEDEPYWESPWGEGRPGWHIECSAMSMKFLGDTIDIHGGGRDLIFPHHENEIAQSESVTGKKFVNYWLHNGFINVDDKKMSKSLGNFFTIREIAEKYPYNIIRFFILSSHYRSPINFSDDLLDAATSSLERIKNSLGNMEFEIGKAPKLQRFPELMRDSSDLLEIDGAADKMVQDFERAMNDDLNTADAIAAIFDFVRKANICMAEKSLPVRSLENAKAKILMLLEVLGLKTETEYEIPKAIWAMSARRDKAKAEKNYDLADKLRQEILDKGYRVQDTPKGTMISKAVDG